MSLTTTNIDDIIKLIDQITDTLTKSDFLTPQEQQRLEQYREYKQYTYKIQNWERLLIASRRGGEYKCIKLIKHYKNKRDSIKTPYDPDKSSILQHKLSKAQRDYIQSTLPPLQKKLDLYLTPRWPEILHLSTPRSRLKQEIEQYFIKKTYPVGNDILIAKKTDVVNEFERIKAKLEYKQAKTGQPQHKGKTPLDEIETPISCTVVAGIEKFSKLISDRRQITEELTNNRTNKNINKYLGKLRAINKELATGGVAIYEAALLLNLPTRPECVLHLATNLGEDEEEKYISKAEDELLQLAIEAKTMKTDRNNKPAKTKQETEENIFRKEGPKNWFVKFESESCILGNQFGVRYVAELLARKNREISAMELYQTVNPPPAKAPKSPESPEPVMDKEYLQDCTKKLEELRIDLEKARKDNNLAEQDRLQQEINKIQETLSKGFGIGGMPREFSNDKARVRSSVTMAINRVIKSIKDNYPKLYLHLKNSIHTGEVCSYKPDRNIDWQL